MHPILLRFCVPHPCLHVTLAAVCQAHEHGLTTQWQTEKWQTHLAEDEHIRVTCFNSLGIFPKSLFSGIWYQAIRMSYGYIRNARFTETIIYIFF